MLNDLLWKLLGKVGIQREENFVFENPNNPSVPLNEPVTEQYKVPKVKGTAASYTPTATPSPVQQYRPRMGRLQQEAPEDVYSVISQAAEKFGVPEELLLDIAFSESSYNPGNINETPEGRAAGSPMGLYQFTPQTWQDVMAYANNPEMSLYGVLPNQDVLDPTTNALAAAYLIKMGQLGKWDASEWNWGQKYTPDELEKLGFYDQSMYHIPGMRPTERLKGKK